MKSRRRLLVVSGAVATALLSMSLTPVWADRDDLVEERDDAARRSAALEEQLAGLDESLKEVYRSLEQVRSEIPDARGKLQAAQASHAAALRDYQQVSARLELTEAELDRLQKKVKDTSQKAEEYGEEVAGLARELYRSGEVGSPLLLALTSATTSDITDRAATAQAMSRAQSQALEGAREALALEQNQTARQEALTDRVQDLANRAKAAKQVAAERQMAASNQLADLEKLEQTEKSRAAVAEASRSKAQAQLEESQAVERRAQQEIARIDEENRQRQLELQQAAAAAESSGGGSGASSSGGSNSSSVSTSGIWGYPLPSWYPITSPFGYRYHPIYGSMILHAGTDIGAPCGTPAIATANGVVTEVSYNQWMGNYVTLNFGLVGGNSYQAKYLHLSAQTVWVGQSVSPGQTVGLVGTTGASTGCHLHYEFIINGEHVDAMAYM
ncbi:MAG: peptidoglycan DD-metalloendopeptidase family protein [Actinomycetaceae bacterium]|nr:peptidoglycan DD-metalloendopeptidase family protein [Actinomycetaceae bacterium]